MNTAEQNEIDDLAQKMDEMDDLRNKISMSDLLEHDMKLVNMGAVYGGTCPACEQKSLFVLDDKKIMICHSCGKSGDIYAYAINKYKLDLHSAHNRLKLFAKMLEKKYPQ